jgi:hypothetical protein
VYPDGIPTKEEARYFTPPPVITSDFSEAEVRAVAQLTDDEIEEMLEASSVKELKALARVGLESEKRVMTEAQAAEMQETINALRNELEDLKVHKAMAQTSLLNLNCAIKRAMTSLTDDVDVIIDLVAPSHKREEDKGDEARTA